MNWKDFYIRYKWIPTGILIKKFGIKRHDVDNFKSRLPTYIRNEFSQWSLSLNVPQEQMKKILQEGWKYYLTQEREIDFDEITTKWLNSILNLTTTQIREDGFGFLFNQRYLKIAFGEEYEKFIETGYTAIAFCIYECYPKREIVIQRNILPIMFNQTRSKVLQHTDLSSFLEHIYYNFLGNQEDERLGININEKKERFVIRYRERDFINSRVLRQYGLTQHFCSHVGGHINLLEQVAAKFLSDLGFEGSSDNAWNAERYRQQHPNKDYSKCKYCSLSPTDLHHLLPRNEYENFIYHEQNVIPLCVQVHGRVTRNKWNEKEKDLYKKAIYEWLKSPNEDAFDVVMELLHENTYRNAEVLFNKKKLEVGD
jgi:hypothetical protein